MKFVWVSLIYLTFISKIWDSAYIIKEWMSDKVLEKECFKMDENIGYIIY